MSSSSSSDNKISESGTTDSNSASSGSAAPSQGDPFKSNYQIIKEGWGDRPTFQASYGLPMDPDGIEEGNKILDGFREADSKKK